MPIITMASEKGGPGKSTIATCLASVWATQGRRVFLLDLDPQKTTSRWAATRAGRPELEEIPGMFAEPSHLKSLLSSLDREHDLVLIDTPGIDASRMRVALSRSNVALFVLSPGGGDFMQAGHTISVINEARELRPEALPLYASIVFNKTRARQLMVRDMRKELEEVLEQEPENREGWHIATSEFGYLDDFAYMITQGEGVHEYAPGSKAARQAYALASELEELYGLFAENK
jgi:chromosome partitioning protein